MTKSSTKFKSLVAPKTFVGRKGGAGPKASGSTTAPAGMTVLIYLVALALFLGMLTACQSAEEPTAVVAVETGTPPGPAETAPTAASPEATDTAAPVEPTAPLPTVTSPVPTPTAPLTATPSPPPAPEPTFYTIEPGDSLVGIAEKFNVTLDALALANGYASLQELTLTAGNELQIPLCQAHQVMSGNTLFSIAAMCNVTLDELIMANLDVIAPLGSLDAVPVGIVLKMPQETAPAEDVDCTAQPAREQVIEYTPQAGESLYCLAEKFQLSTAAIIQANSDRLGGGVEYGRQALLIPPINGAVYVVSAEDVANGLTTADLAEWYDVTAEEVLDWNGNPVSDPLEQGQQLFIPGANLAFGLYQLVTPEETPTAEGEEGDEAGGEEGTQGDQTSGESTPSASAP